MIQNVLLDRKAIKFGDFTLPYGNKTGYFVDVKEISTDPKILDMIASELSKEVREKAVAGVELGAVPLLVATALRSGIPFVIVRKEYNHGTKERLIGKVSEGDGIDIIEDVVSTGNSILMAANLLRDRGAKVSRAITVVDREEGGAQLLRDNGIELVSLVRISEVMKDRK
jgi:orotate phosphoribosyltransferase